MSVTQQQVVTLLENVLFESATLAEANAAMWQANAAATSVSSLATAMASSGEEKIAATVEGYYLAALGRAPTADEVRYYVAIAEQGLSTVQIAAGDVSNATWDQISQYFSHSPEFLARGGLDTTGGLDQTGLLLQVVPWLYESVLGRAPSTAEVAYYDNLVLNGTGLGTLFRYFTASTEFHTDTDAEIAAALANFGISAVAGDTSAVSTISIGAVSPPPSTSAPTPSTPTPSTPTPSVPTPTPTFGTLTTGTDTIDDSAMAGAHTYYAVIGGTSATLDSTDHLTGNGLATLAMTDSTDTQVLLAGSLAGIQAITVDASAGNVGSSGSSFDVSAISNLTSLTVTASGNGGDYITATTSVGVSLTTSSATVSIDNAGATSITDSSLTTLQVAGTVGELTLTTSTSNLIIDGSGTLQTGIVDSTLYYTLTVTGAVTLGGSLSALFALPGGLGYFDSSGDTADVYIDGSAAVFLLDIQFGSGASFFEGSTSRSSYDLISNSSASTGAVTLDNFANIVIGANTYSSVTLEGTGVSVNLFLMDSLNVDGLTLTGTLTAYTSSLTLAGTGTGASSIANIYDGSLTSLTVTGDVTLGASGAPVSLGSSVATVDLSGDTDTTGRNYFTLNSSATVTLGATNNHIALSAVDGLQFSFSGSGNDSLSISAAASYNSTPNIVFTSLPSSFVLSFGTQTGISLGTAAGISAGSSSALISQLESALASDPARSLEFGFDGSNTYILESDDGTLTSGHATLIEVTGLHSVFLYQGLNTFGVT